VTKCLTCDAEVKNPEHPKHIASKKHQDAIFEQEFNLDENGEVFENEDFEGNVSYEHIEGEFDEVEVPIGKIVSVDEDGINTIHITSDGKETPVIYNELRQCTQCGKERLCSNWDSSMYCPVCDNLMTVEEYDQIIDMREKGIFIDTAVGEKVPQHVNLSEGNPYESLIRFIDCATQARSLGFLKVPQIKNKIMENIVFEIICQIDMFTEEQIEEVRKKYFELMKMN